MFETIQEGVEVFKTQAAVADSLREAPASGMANYALMVAADTATEAMARALGLTDEEERRLREEGICEHRARLARKRQGGG